MLADGRIAPVPERRFPLEQVADAHRYLESGEHTGKVILTL
jgi:NADPH:quinone reductase-like Zn-dependent oxidoreductase